MKIITHDDGPLEVADPKNFVGSATVRRIAGLSADGSVKGFRVSFAPGGRTNWHRHTGVQLLLVVEGEGRVQKAGDPVRVIRAGDSVSIAPGETHWHGAAPDSPMTHVAINLGATTEWLEPVREADYRSAT